MVLVFQIDNRDGNYYRIEPKGQKHVPLAQDQFRAVQTSMYMELAFYETLISMLRQYANVFVHVAQKYARNRS